MSTPADWVWVTLTPAQIALAEEAMAIMIRNVQERHLGTGRYQTTPDERYQKRLGMLGEVAFRVITGRPLPTAHKLANSWHGPDCDGYALKTVGKKDYGLPFIDRDLAGVTQTLVLLYGGGLANERLAIVGHINPVCAQLLRVWAGWFPQPCWLVSQHDLAPWAVEVEAIHVG